MRRFLTTLAALAATAVTTTAALPAAQADTLRGPDVSSYQRTVDWRAVKSSGADFAFAKATESTSYRDAYFPRNWGHIEHEGLVKGAYHFAHMGVSAVAQARYFAHYVNDNGGFAHSFAILDVEGSSGSAGSWSANRAWIQAWVNEVRHAGHPAGVIIYSSNLGWWASHVGAWFPVGVLAWPANYGSHVNVLAGAGGWDFWQYTDGVWNFTRWPSSTPGIGRGDISVFSGPRARLLALSGYQEQHAYASRNFHLSNHPEGTDVRGFQNATNKRSHARRLPRIHVDGTYGSATERAKHRIEYLLGFPLGTVKHHGATRRVQQFIAHPDKRPAAYLAAAIYRKEHYNR